jgi:hypothetical protein
MAGIRLLDGIGGKKTDGVGHPCLDVGLDGRCVRVAHPGINQFLCLSHPRRLGLGHMT